MRRRRYAAAAALMLTGCAGPQDFMHPGGPAAAGLARLGWTALVAFSITTVVVWLLLAWVATRRRGSLDTHAPIDVNGGQRWILVGGFLIPTVVLAALFAMMLLTLRAYPMETAPHGYICAADASTCPPASIRVIGRQWWFDVEYLFDRQDLYVHGPTEIHVPVDQPVVIELQTRDVIHSFWVPKLHGKVDLIPGQTNEIEIRASTPGVYAGECAEYCGEQHAHMRLQVVAQSSEDFQRWLARQREPGAEPGDANLAHGRDLFLGAACALCHTVRGTGAHGQVGPDLTHVGSRATLAGGMLPNTTANLEAWITHAQSIKPGSLMPDVTAFGGADLRAVVAYLQSLR